MNSTDIFVYIFAHFPMKPLIALSTPPPTHPPTFQQTKHFSKDVRKNSHFLMWETGFIYEHAQFIVALGDACVWTV